MPFNALHLCATGVLIRSTADRYLLVQTFNRQGRGLILPGGIVEPDESPAVGAQRETLEEVGLSIETGPLLAVSWRGSTDGRPAGAQFVFAATTTIDEDTPLQLQAEEIAAAHWLTSEEVVARYVAAGREVIAAALAAWDSGHTAYVD